jgi:sensor histidine kinase YesM
MVLQPLVENAVVHGLSGRAGAGVVSVQARIDDGLLQVEVLDDGAGMPPEACDALNRMFAGQLGTFANGPLALRNIYERIHLIFGGSCRVRIASDPGAFTRVTLTFPVRRRRGEA